MEFEDQGGHISAAQMDLTHDTPINRLSDLQDFDSAPNRQQTK